MNQRGLGNGYPAPTYPPQPSFPAQYPGAAPAPVPGRPVSQAWLAAQAALPIDMVALARAQVAGDTVGMQAAQQRVAADQAIMTQGPYGAVAPPSTSSSSSTPYIIAGVIGVVLLGGLIYAATK